MEEFGRDLQTLCSARRPRFHLSDLCFSVSHYLCLYVLDLAKPL